MPAFTEKYKPAVALLLALGALAGCGVKPGTLTPPSGEAAPPFPKNYPVEVAPHE
jgi:predicted small lipoprotein YifL